MKIPIQDYKRCYYLYNKKHLLEYSKNYYTYQKCAGKLDDDRMTESMKQFAATYKRHSKTCEPKKEIKIKTGNIVVKFD